MDVPSQFLIEVNKICDSVETMIDTTLGYSEHCYQQLLRQLLERAGFFCETEAPVYFKTKGPNPINFGWGRIDILVPGEKEVVIIELKANVKYSIKAEQQLKRYLLHYPTKLKKTGLLMCFNTDRRVPCLINIIR